MRWLGPLYLLPCLLLWPLQSVSAGSPKKNPSAGGFEIKYFGEGGGGIETTPDDRDYRESVARGGPHTPTEEPEPEPDYPPERPEPRPGGLDPAPIVPPSPTEGAHLRRDPAAIGRPRSWPGARSRRSAERGRARSPQAGQGDASQDEAEAPDEQLRDAPAGLGTGNYSLWSGLSKPLILPSSKVGSLPADKARILGRKDYEQHILGAGTAQAGAPAGRRVPQAPKAIRAPDRGVFLPGEEAGERGQFVVMELDVSESPGEFRDAVAELADRAGFQMDERFAPAFFGADKRKVAVQGWLPADRIGDAMSLERVGRLEAGRAPGLGSQVGRPAGGRTELLLGIRIPPERSPNEALKKVVARLESATGFEFSRAIAYQRIPGTSRMVLVVSGKVPVRNIGRLMADPEVVKVAPSPEAPARPPARQARPGIGPIQRFVSFAIQDHPFIFLVAILLTVSLVGSRRRKDTERVFRSRSSRSRLPQLSRR